VQEVAELARRQQPAGRRKEEALSTQSRWYVVHCEPHRDRQVEHVMAVRGVEAYSPHIARTRRHNGKKPLFPGYVFARLALDTGVWSALRFSPGIKSLIEIGGGPCPVGDEIVDEVRRRAEAYVPPAPDPSAGDRVVVKGGALEGLEGVFNETLSGEERVAVLIDMMHRQVRVELSAGLVRRVRHGGKAA
jgi:transcriptional antiterminator RfaH